MSETSTNSLQPISLTELSQMKYEPIPEIVKGLLTPGLYILAGTPKVGKSFFSLQLSYSVARGEFFLGRDTIQGRVLYLALEDSLQRLQSRIFRMFGNDAESNSLDLDTKSTTLEDGLIDMLQNYVAENPDTNLIIIDTLQMVRTESSTYMSDYSDIGALKAFADDNNICVLLIHHTTKTKSADVFSTIAGSQGIRGAADGTLVLYRETNDDNNACLSVQGRDIPTETYHLSFDEESMQWQMGEETERIHPAIKIIGEAIKDVIDGTEYEKGFCTDTTAAELLEALPELKTLGKSNLNTITNILIDNKDDLEANYNIKVYKSRTGTKRKIVFER